MSFACIDFVLLLMEVNKQFSNARYILIVENSFIQSNLNNVGEAPHGREDEADTDSSVFVKYNRMLHGKKNDRGRKTDTLTIKFLKKYIHYAKHRIQPELTDEVCLSCYS